MLGSPELRFGERRYVKKMSLPEWSIYPIEEEDDEEKASSPDLIYVLRNQNRNRKGYFKREKKNNNNEGDGSVRQAGRQAGLGA